MAWSVKLFAVGEPNKNKRWEVEPTWWNARELLSDPRLRELPDGQFADVVGVLSGKEALDLDDRFGERVLSHQREERDRLRALLDAEATLVAVWIFDWDSGL